MSTEKSIATSRINELRNGTRQKLRAASLAAHSTAALINTTSLTRNTADDTKSQSAAATNPSGTEHPVDADMRTVLAAFATLNPKSIEALRYDEARKQPTLADAVKLVVKKQGRNSSPAALIPGVISFEDTIPTRTGMLRMRIYMPAGPGPFPVVVYFHGGGWVLADKEVYDAGARGIAKQANAIVVSVDYRRAPEAKFPAQHDDALAAYKWVTTHAPAFNGDPAYLALAGECVGGNLAIATAIAARDQGLTAPLHVLAVYPIAQASDLWTPSYQDSEHAKPLNRAMMLWFANAAFSRQSDATDSRIDLLSANLKGLPPITLISARIDPLRHDAELLAKALRSVNVKVEHMIYEGVTHEFFGMAAVVAKAREAQVFAGRQLQASFRTSE